MVFWNTLALLVFSNELGLIIFPKSLPLPMTTTYSLCQPMPSPRHNSRGGSTVLTRWHTNCIFFFYKFLQILQLFTNFYKFFFSYLVVRHCCSPGTKKKKMLKTNIFCLFVFTNILAGHLLSTTVQSKRYLLVCGGNPKKLCTRGEKQLQKNPA